MTPLADTHLDELRSQLAGRVIVAGDPEYHSARHVWNADIEVFPEIVAKVSNTADVVACLAYAKSPFASNTGCYVNMMSGQGQDRVHSTYGPAKPERLAQVKAVYDPDNRFHHNANIKPAAR